MTKLTVLGATIALSMMTATPIFAQSAVFAQQEPGAYASMYPNGDVLNARVRTTAHSMGAMAFLPPGKHHAKRHLARH